jgi:ElaB/YqjD/DUF883 family membrane-anchored ribosome-binding protein
MAGSRRLQGDLAVPAGTGLHGGKMPEIRLQLRLRTPWHAICVSRAGYIILPPHLLGRLSTEIVGRPVRIQASRPGPYAGRARTNFQEESAMAIRRNGHARTRAQHPDLKRSADQVVESVKELGDEARSLAEKQISQVRDSAAEYWEDGRRQAGEWEESFEEMIREKPIQSLAIALGAGFLVGFLFRGR